MENPSPEHSNEERPKNVFLIGPMGAGKSTVGRRLAKALNVPFFDSDHELEGRTGASISLIFDVEGEQGFRLRESNLLNELTERQPMVLATGGGIVLDPENRRLLSERGFVVYLRAPLEKLVERTSRDNTRPLLQTDDPAARLAEILAQREPLYQQIADLVVDTDTLSLSQVIQKIKRATPWKQ